MKKKLISFLLSFCLLAGYINIPASVQAEDTETGTYTGLDAEYHTQEQIREYYRNHPVNDMEAEYVTKPSVTEPYEIGELTEATKQDALNNLNIYRYIAGVPEIAITDTTQNYAQAAALISAVNRKLSHAAERPAGMSDEMYEMAVYGTFNCNLAALDNKLSSTVAGWMLEINGDPYYGHRRQVLDYYNKQTGFGIAQSVSGGYYSSVYVNAVLEEDKIISYPGQNQPLEYFGTGYAWTVIIPERVDESKINVKLTDTKTGKAWDFNKNSGNFLLDGSQGRSACAIFAPQNINYREGDKYKVEITGINNPISYEVNMFLLKDYVPLEGIKFSMAASYPVVGGNCLCRVNYIPENATNKIVTWKSSNPDIAEPVWAGTTSCTVIAKKEGTAIITATSEDGGYTDTIEINVKPEATGIMLSETEVTIGIGQSFVLEGSTYPAEARDMVVYKENYNKNIISVENTRLLNNIEITGKATGSTDITAYAYSNHDATAVCHVNVVEPVYATGISLDKTETELMLNDSLQLNAVFSPANVTCKNIEWSSSDTNIVRVENGKITTTGNSFGKAVVTAKALDGSGKEARCTVTVYDQHMKMAAPSVQSYSSDKVVLKGISGCEYSMDKNNWQDSNEFTNLEPDHDYTFYIRKKAVNYIKAGETSEGTTVRTRKTGTVPTSKPGTIKSPAPSVTPTSKPGTTKSPAPQVTQTAVPSTTKKPETAAVQTTRPGNCKHINTKVQNDSKATCTKKGYTGDTYCVNCGIKTAMGEDIEALGHDYTKSVTKQPSIEEEGIITYTCSRCSGFYTEKIAKLTKNDDIANDKNNGNQDTQKENNSKITINGYNYIITNSSSVAFVGLTNNKIKKVVIPKTIKTGNKTYKVTSIAKNALKKSKITSVTIGANVETVEDSAFKNCNKLGKIIIKSSKLKKVGKNALKGIKSSAKIKVPAKKLSTYKKLFKGKGQKSKVKIVK